MNVDMFIHKENNLKVEFRSLDIKLDINNSTLDINNGVDRITLFFFDEKGLIDFKNQVVQQYELMKRRGES